MQMAGFNAAHVLPKERNHVCSSFYLCCNWAPAIENLLKHNEEEENHESRISN